MKFHKITDVINKVGTKTQALLAQIGQLIKLKPFTTLIIAGLFISIVFVTRPDVNNDDNVDSVLIQQQPTPVAVIDNSFKVQDFSVTGQIESVKNATLSSESGGSVTNINVSIGDKVFRGQVLASLNAADELAALEQANGQLAAALTGVESAQIGVQQVETNIASIESRRNTALANINTNLNTTGLQAYLSDNYLDNVRSSDNLVPPTITGNYNSSIEGTYFIELYRSGANSGFSYRLSGLETGTGTVSTSAPQPLGSRGLFIQFPPNFEGGSSVNPVIWEVPIPNTRGSSYVQTDNTRRQTETEFQTSLDQARDQLSQARAGVINAQASVQIARSGVRAAQIRLGKKTITAPFAGEISDVMVDVGEFSSPGMPIINLVASNLAQVSVPVANNRIRFISIGQEVTITSNNIQVPGFVTAISPQSIGGSSEVIVSIPGSNQVVVGASADVLFSFQNEATQENAVAERENILPLSAITVNNGRDAIYVINNEGQVEPVLVELGPVSAGGVVVNTDLDGFIIIENALIVAPGQQVTPQNI